MHCMFCIFSMETSSIRCCRPVAMLPCRVARPFHAHARSLAGSRLLPALSATKGFGSEEQREAGGAPNVKVRGWEFAECW